MTYEILKSSQPELLSNIVNKALREKGATLHGGVAVAIDSQGHIHYAQAITYSESENKNGAAKNT